MLIELNNTNFAEVIAKGTVLVDFWAAWCGPCRMLGPTVEEIAKENQDMTVAKLNVDDYPEIASRFDVRSIPTLVFFHNGEARDSSIGVVSKSVIQQKIDRLKA